MADPMRRLVPAYVAAEPPETYDAQQAAAEADAARYGEDPVELDRPAIAAELGGLDLTELGIEPRWTDYHTEDCLAALELPRLHLPELTPVPVQAPAASTSA